jgi:hypothetical protein
MARCGFDAFELPDGAPVADWLAAFDEIGVVYQPAADGRRPAFALRRSDADSPPIVEAAGRSEVVAAMRASPEP